MFSYLKVKALKALRWCILPVSHTFSFQISEGRNLALFD
jgi:hypothetical protein